MRDQSTTLPPADDAEDQVASLDNDEDLQKEVLGKLRTHNAKGKANRMAQVQLARDQRLYFKGIQQFYWNEDIGDVVFDSEDDSPYDRTFNVFQGYGKIFQSTFMGARPKVRAEADDPFDSISIRNTAKADTYERVYRKFNDTPTQQLETSRLLFTDGRVVTRTASRNGKEITEFWGVLESRLPITAPDDIEVPLKNCSLIELEKEYPSVQLKRDYSEARKKINSGNGDSYERNARLAVMRQAGTDTAIDIETGDDNYGLATKTWSYMRPEFFEEFQETSRVQLEKLFPEGLCVVHNGDVYLESYAQDPDAILDVIHALPGDGMARGSIGQPLMPLQDSINTAQNLIEETFDHGIPTTYYDVSTNIDGLNKQREMPGASRKMTRAAGQAAEDHFFETEAVNPSQQLMGYVESLKTEQAAFVTAMQPALQGAQMPDQKTASGYAQARTMALGQMAIVWKPYTAWFAREMTRAVRMASKRDDEIKATLPPVRRGGKPSAVRIAPHELVGLSFTNYSDENFPETWTEKSNKVMQLMQDPDFKVWVTQEPDNLYLFKEIIALDELVIPGEDLRNNVLADIAQMENEPMQPDPNAPAQPFPSPGQPPVAPPMVSSITIDPSYLDPEDFAIGYNTVKHWIQSSDGQTAKQQNPDWFKNVHAYGLQYKQGVDASKAAALPPPPPPPSPPYMNITANYKDLPPETQMGAIQRDQLPPPVNPGANIQPGA